MMQLEVEQKYPLLQRAELVAALDSLGCRWEPPIAQSDLYFAHPARNFKQTDEALRLRRSGDEVMITYKGPKLDTTTKTRRELELPIAGGARGFDQYRELLEVLGFQSVREVRKLRQPGSVRWQGEEIQIALDDVEELGSFVELELLVAPAELSAAQNHLASLAQRLQLTAPERRGYLDLLLHGK